MLKSATFFALKRIIHRTSTLVALGLFSLNSHAISERDVSKRDELRSILNAAKASYQSQISQAELALSSHSAEMIFDEVHGPASQDKLNTQHAENALGFAYVKSQQRSARDPRKKILQMATFGGYGARTQVISRAATIEIHTKLMDGPEKAREGIIELFSELSDAEKEKILAQLFRLSDGPSAEERLNWEEVASSLVLLLPDTKNNKQLLAQFFDDAVTGFEKKTLARASLLLSLNEMGDLALYGAWAFNGITMIQQEALQLILDRLDGLSRAIHYYQALSDIQKSQLARALIALADGSNTERVVKAIENLGSRPEVFRLVTVIHKETVGLNVTELEVIQKIIDSSSQSQQSALNPLLGICERILKSSPPRG